MHNTVPDNFDIPDDFNFEFYGQSYDGSNPDNRIQVLTTGFLHFVDDGTTTEEELRQTAVDVGRLMEHFPSDFWDMWWRLQHKIGCKDHYTVYDGTILR